MAHRQGRKKKAAIFLVMVAGSLGGAAQARFHRVEAMPDARPIPVSESPILVLPVDARFEQLATADPVASSGAVPPDFERRIRERVESRLRDLGASVVSLPMEKDSASPGACLPLMSEHPGLRVLRLRVLVKVGSRGFWNPYNGEIASANNSARFKGVLSECDGGTTAWSNEAILRALPKDRPQEFDLALDALLGLTAHTEDER